MWNSAGVRRPLQKPLVFLLHHGPAGRLFSRMWRDALDRYAASGRG